MTGRWFEDYKVGETIEGPGITMTEADIVDFAFKYDPQYFHMDKEEAKQGIYGGLIASGWQTIALGFRSLMQGGLMGRSSLGSPGLDEVRFHKPVFPGDTVHGRAEITEKRESASKPDRGLVFVIYRIMNQKGEMVVSFKGTQFILKRPAAGKI